MSFSKTKLSFRKKSAKENSENLRKENLLDSHIVFCALFFSYIFEMRGSTDIGLQFERSLRVPDFGNGMTLAIFCEWGNLPAVIFILIKNLKY